jgi:hypothetical protein
MTPDRPAGPNFEYRLAEIVYLEERGAAPAGFMIPLARQPVTGQLGFEDEFSPEARITRGHGRHTQESY